MAKINDIPNRFYGLSPAVEFGGDRECTNHDFYQTENEEPVEIGKLGYGTRVHHKLTKLPYIIINIEKHEGMQSKIIKKINDTIKLMYNTSSPYLFRLLNHYEDEHNVFLIMEPYDGETLEQRLTQEEKLDVNTTIRYIKQVAIGMKTLHNNQIYNITVFPETILLGECLKLTDYGLKMNVQSDKESHRPTFQIKSNATTHTITPYTSPEELEGILNKVKPSLSAKTDSWNLGILMYEMLTGFKSPFKGNSIESLCEGIKNCDVDLSLIEDEVCRLLIEKLLKKEKDERLDIDKLFELEFIKSVDIEEPVIDLNDNIINPKDEEKYKQALLENVDHNEENVNDNQVMQSLKFENENLRKKIEQLEMQMNADEEESPKKKIKTSKSGNVNTPLEDKSEKKEDENDKNESNDQGITDEDLDNKEKQLDEMLKQQNNDSQNEEDENSDEISEIDEDDDEITLQKKILKLKTKYTMLKDEYKEKHKRQKELEQIYTKAKTEYDNVVERSKAQTVTEEESKEQQEHKKNIKDISTKIQNSIDTFDSSQLKFKEIVEQLINISNSLHEKTMTQHNLKKDKKINEYKQLIDDNMSLFQEKKNKEEQQKKEDENKLNELYEKMKNGYKNIKEMNQYKSDYEMGVIKEDELKKKIEFLQEKNKVDKMLLETCQQNIQNYRENLNFLDTQKCTLINVLNKSKTFIKSQLPDLYEEYESIVQLEKTI